MSAEIILRYVHFLSIFAIVGSLSAEHILLKKVMKRSEITRLAKIDAVYGIAALTLLVVGLTLWLGSFGKPSVYYSKNWIFHLKITLFLFVGLLSIKPTVFFLKQRKGGQEEIVHVPGSVLWMLRLELVLLAVIPLLAGLMSHGFGYFGN